MIAILKPLDSVYFFCLLTILRHVYSEPRHALITRFLGEYFFVAIHVAQMLWNVVAHQHVKAWGMFRPAFQRSSTAHDLHSVLLRACSDAQEGFPQVRDVYPSTTGLRRRDDDVVRHQLLVVATCNVEADAQVRELLLEEVR
ncbi:hypothetical protein D3C80_1786180 [compost metagenome]